MPQGTHRVDVLIGDRAALGVVRPDGAELRLQVADADAQQEPPAGQDVDAGDLLGQGDRIALGQQEDAGAQATPE